MSNIKYWLSSRDTFRYATRFNHIFQLISESDVTMLCKKCNEETLEGFFSKTNLGDMIISLYAYPINKNMVSTGNIYNYVKAGTTTYSDIHIRHLNPMYIFDMGTVRYNANTYLDLSGYTVIRVFLPYYGYIDLNPNDCANKYVVFRMGVDFSSGSATYYIGVCDAKPPSYTNVPANSYSYNNDSKYDIRIIKTVTFQLGYSLPISSSDANERLRNATLAAITSTAAIAITKNPIPVLSATTPKTNITTVVPVSQSGASDKSFDTLLIDAPKPSTTKQYEVSGVSETMRSAAFALNQLPYTTHTEAVKNTAGLFFASTHIHFIVIKPKVKQQTSTFYHLYGRPLGEVRKLSELKGFTSITDIHLDSAGLASATNEEVLMLKEALVKGVYL